MNSDGNVIENRLKKDIDSLKREKQVLLSDIQVKALNIPTSNNFAVNCQKLKLILMHLQI